MARAGRRFLKFLLFLFLLLVLAVLGLNLWRLSFQTPEPVVGSVVRVRNAYVDFYGAKNGARVLLFDAGTDPLGRGLDALLTKMGASRDEVTDVFVTHGHGDHLGSASGFRNAKVHAGAKDVGLVDGSDLPLKNRLFTLLQPSAGVKVNDSLDGARAVDVGAAQTVKAIPVPGHTAGSYFYLWEKVLFVGDSINYNEKKGELELPPDAFDWDPALLKKSLGELPKTLAKVQFERICTGHGGCTPPPQTKKLLDDFVKKMQETQ